ncbi:RHS repeat domain-containing protein, partial [Bacteroides bouchesdurhonensis]
LNLPDEVTFANGNSIRYEYAADGTKLRTVHKTGATTLTTDYCGNAVYENGVLRMLLNEAGYVSFPDRKCHFYLKDHQGNTRVVADKDGNVEETNAYYPFGGTFTSTASVQPYKYNGKELDAKNGLNWYDYGARHYDAAIGRRHVVDPMSEKYYSSSLYMYCANNPMKYVDYNGDSITVLNLGYGLEQHMAILIQNKEKVWQYFSINGDNVYVSGKFTGGRKFNDIAVGEFKSPQDFLNSQYNTEGNGSDTSINSYGFTEGYIIPTSEEQDEIIRSTFVEISTNEPYDLLLNNCSVVAQRALEKGGVKTHYQKNSKFNIPKVNTSLRFTVPESTQRSMIPSTAFKSIIKYNPKGKLIYK